MPPACCSASCTLCVIRLTSTIGAEGAHGAAVRQGDRAVRACSGGGVRAVSRMPDQEAWRGLDQVSDAPEEEERFFPQRHGHLAETRHDAGVSIAEFGGPPTSSHL